MTRILIIDDETDCREILEALLSKNFSLLLAVDGPSGIQLATKERPDLILVDVQMPNMSGIEVCRQIRKDQELRETPIIMISAFADENCRTECFLYGADDFIAKPFAGRELLARVMSKLAWKRQLRNADSEQTIKIGNLSLDEKRLEICINGSQVELTQFETKLLRQFVARPGEVVSRDALSDALWGSTSVGGRTIDTHIYSLRRKISGFDYRICTVHGAGYALRPR